MTVLQQRSMIQDYDPSDPDFGEALVMFFLSTGTHPCVLESPDVYGLTITPDFYSYVRPKNRTPVSFTWSKLMTRTRAWVQIADHLGLSIQWYAQETARIGRLCKIPDRVAPNRLRHDMFTNLARIGLDPFSIMHRAGTSLHSIGRFYTVGMADSKRLTDDERNWLKELMDP